MPNQMKSSRQLRPTLLVVKVQLTARELERRLDKLARKYGVHAGQLSLLMQLFEWKYRYAVRSEWFRFGALAELLGMSSSATSHLLNGLVDKGLCERTDSPPPGERGGGESDGRAVWFRVTVRGEGVCRNCIDGFWAIERCLRRHAYQWGSKIPNYWLDQCKDDLRGVEKG